MSLERTGSQPSDNTRVDAAWLEAHWMPYTGNRNFKANPRMITEAAGCYYTDAAGRKIFDSLSGLWCTGLGHGRQEITEAVSRQIARLDYAPAFQFGHPLSFELANAIEEVMPPGLDRVFFTTSGSDAADTALKIARAYWSTRGKATKTRLIGREKAYHGVNFGGISVGGLPANRKAFGDTLQAAHLPHTQLPANVFSRGMPQQGAELADRLLDLIQLYDASTIAAVIVEPFSGSAGVIVPPAGYLQRLRDICNQHDILLIFDEVISGFGRVGAFTAAEAFGVTPDMLTIAKQVTNGAQPLGAVVAKREIYETFMRAAGPDYLPELSHGYTYSGHPVACAAGIAALKLLRDENAMERVNALAPGFEAAVHGLKGSRHVTDIRNIGLAAGITLDAFPGEPARRPYQVAMKCWDKGFYVRYGADTIQLAPPFVAEQRQIDDLINVVGDALASCD